MLDSTATLSLIVALLVCQLVILAVLIVFYTKYKRLKKTIDNYMASEDLERQRRSTASKEQNKNEYIAGRRDTNTLVRTNSNESVVFVPSPMPNRRSGSHEKELNTTTTTVVQENFGFVNDHFASSPINEVPVGNEIPAIHVEEEQNEATIDQEEIYENQDFVTMAMDGENQNYKLQVLNDPNFGQSGACSADEEIIDEPIYVNREMIDQQRYKN